MTPSELYQILKSRLAEAYCTTDYEGKDIY